MLYTFTVPDVRKMDIVSTLLQLHKKQRTINVRFYLTIMLATDSSQSHPVTYVAWFAVSHGFTGGGGIRDGMRGAMQLVMTVHLDIRKFRFWRDVSQTVGSVFTMLLIYSFAAAEVKKFDRGIMPKTRNVRSFVPVDPSCPAFNGCSYIYADSTTVQAYEYKC